MIRKLIVSSAVGLSALLQGEIVTTHQIDDILPRITQNTLCLFDIDDTLIDTPYYLGSPPWRSWVKSKLPDCHTDFVLYDALTLYIAQNIPYKAVEPTTVQLITDLQNEGVAAFAFTSRGRSQWYTTDLDGVDRFTHDQLEIAGIDFKKTQVPSELQLLEPTYFDDGIIFAQHIKKGDLLKHLFMDLNYRPDLLIFVDDKLDQVQSVEAAAADVGIPFLGFWYRRVELDRAQFKPMVSNIQLESLLLSGEIVNDERALELAEARADENPQTCLKEILEKVDVEQQLFPLIQSP